MPSSFRSKKVYKSLNIHYSERLNKAAIILNDILAFAIINY